MERFSGVKVETLKKAGKIAGSALSPVVLSGCTNGELTASAIGVFVLGGIGAGALVLLGSNSKQIKEISLKERDKMKDYPAPVVASIAVMSVPKGERKKRQQEVLNIIAESKGKK